MYRIRNMRKLSIENEPRGSLCRRPSLCALMTIIAAGVLASSLCAAVESPTNASSDASTSAPQITQKANLFDVDASGTDVKSVLETLARCSGASIIVSPDVKGEVTAHITQTPLDQILDYLSTTVGFAWRKTGDAYLVASKEKLEAPVTVVQPPPPETELLVWQCRNIRPSEAVTTIQKLFPKLQVVEGPSSVTPTLTSSTSGTQSTGFGMGTSATSTPSIGQSGSTSGGQSSRIVLVGDPSEIAKAKDTLSQLDVGREQVYIKVAIAEISNNANKELGLEWAFSDLVVTETSQDSGIGFGRFTKQGMTFTGTISALIKQGDANLLAQPNISVVDGESANILIGDRILFPKLVGYTQFGTPMYDKEEESVGICLQIVPRITGNDEIMMTLYPQVSLVTSYLKTQAGDYPQISTREAKTTVSVKSGETLAIGGLLREDKIATLSKIPILGDLPIIGGFFKRSKTTKERTEIIIFLSPTILSSN